MSMLGLILNRSKLETNVLDSMNDCVCIVFQHGNKARKSS